MTMTVFVPVGDTSLVHTLYVSIMIENLRQLGEYELLQGKISIHLLRPIQKILLPVLVTIPARLGSWNNPFASAEVFPV